MQNDIAKKKKIDRFAGEQIVTNDYGVYNDTGIEWKWFPEIKTEQVYKTLIKVYQLYYVLCLRQTYLYTNTEWEIYETLPMNDTYITKSMYVSYQSPKKKKKISASLPFRGRNKKRVVLNSVTDWSTWMCKTKIVSHSTYLYFLDSIILFQTFQSNWAKVNEMRIKQNQNHIYIHIHTLVTIELTE